MGREARSMQTFRVIGGLCKHMCRTHPHYFRLIVSVKIYITPAVRDPHLLPALADGLR